jgi:RNA polymerase sigma-70 factor, ECF subfamily
MLICRTSQKRRKQSFFFQELRRISVNPSTKGSYWHLLAFRSKQNPFGTWIALTKGMRARAEPDQWASIINQAKSGDSAAFDQLATFYQDRLRRFISRKLSNHADAEDLYQKVLFRAYSGLNTFRGDSGLDTWLISIAKRALAEYYRSVFGKIKIDATTTAEKTLTTYDHSLEEICDIRNQIRNCVITMMKTLTHDQQVALVLCDIYGFSDKASCRIIGKKLGVFKHLLHKSRQLMNLISHDTCAVVRKDGDFAQCLSCNALDRQMLGTLPLGISSKNSPLPLPSELLGEIHSLIDSKPLSN